MKEKPEVLLRTARSLAVRVSNEWGDMELHAPNNVRIVWRCHCQIGLIPRANFVYVLVDPKAFKPFYVGKADGWKRPIKHVTRTYMNKRPFEPLPLRIQSMSREGRVPLFWLPYFFEDPEDAYDAETRMIEQFGREDEGGLLVNVRRGGGGRRTRH